MIGEGPAARSIKPRPFLHYTLIGAPLQEQARLTSPLRGPFSVLAAF